MVDKGLNVPQESFLRRIMHDQNMINLMLAVVVGLLAGIGAVGFRFLIWGFQELAYFEHESVLESIRNLGTLPRILIPTFGGFIVGAIVYFLAPEAKGHGVPEVMEAVAFKGGVIRKRVVAIKAFASAITIASGGAAGREGPIVHIGSAIGSTFGQLGKVSRNRMRTLVACGATAGIAATFNAPIAGAFFSLEIILGNITFSSFGPVILASVAATVISRMCFGNYPAFALEELLRTPGFSDVHLADYPSSFLLGILAGLGGLLFVIALYKFEDVFDAVPLPLYAKAAFGGLVIGLVGLAYPEILGVGYETIDTILKEPMKMALAMFLILFALKIFGTSMTLGSGGSGGVFAPSLFMGAALGAAWGALVHQVTGVDVSIPLYAMVGMGAFVSATTHATITSFLIIFEMTQDYKIILPLMLGCITSTVVAKLLMRDSIYTMKLSRRGVDMHGQSEELLMRSLRVGEHLTGHMKTIPECMMLRDVFQVMTTSPFNCYPVINTQGEMIGVLYFNDIKKFIFEEGAGDLLVAGELAEKDFPTVHANESFFDAMQTLVNNDVHELPVIGSAGPKKPIGVMSRRDILMAYNRELLKEKN